MNKNKGLEGGWMMLAQRTYEELVRDASEEERTVIISILREVLGPTAPLSDADLWNSVQKLIRLGILQLNFRVSEDGIEVRPEFLGFGRADNDNPPP